ncbi:MAG TPA: hypothetical protein VFL29_10115 [Candidatus Dormibacteraeota bacterium]|nr:hypothetical protein [Candidatus Dormibacteraeota bacterium]
MRNAIIALAVVVGILAGFYGGYKVGFNNVSASTNSSRSSNQGTARNNTGGGFIPGRGANAAVCPSPGSTPSAASQVLARGTVSHITSTSMTVTNSGCTVTVTFAPSTTVQKQVTGSVSDIANNDTVTVIGTRGADGSVTAVTIQITPAGGFTRPGAAASPSPGG